MDTREMSPGDRRELRSLVKKQFAVLRNDVKRREREMEGEIEAALLRKYRQQDERINQARREAERAYNDMILALRKVAEDLRADLPDLKVELGKYGRPWDLEYGDPSRIQERRALLAAIPQQISDAQTKLDQEELSLLRDLTVGALDTEQAQTFLSRIPTVGALVPKARLAELEASAE